MCCVLIVSVGVTNVGVADRLIYFLKRFGAFIISQLADYYTIHTDSRIYCSFLSVTQGPLASLLQKEKPQLQQRPSFHPRVVGTAASGATLPMQLGLQAVPTDHVHPLPHLQLPGLVAPFQHLVGAAVLVRHWPRGPPLIHIDPVRPFQR